MGKTLVLNVKLGTNCKKCGEGGVVNETGLCMKCIGKRAVDSLRKEGRMKINMTVEGISVKGNIDKEGTFHKQLIARVSFQYDADTEAFLSRHLLEPMVAAIDTKQLKFED